jgi:predicted phosphodiesterase
MNNMKLWLLDKQQRKKYPKVYGVFGDLHIPYHKEGALEFLEKTFEENGVTDIICLGDLVDFISINSHGLNPKSPSQIEEFTITAKEVNRYKKAFPEMIYIVGNHETRIERFGLKQGIHPMFLKSVPELFQHPKGWKYVTEFIENGIRFIHGDGDGNSGRTPAYNVAKNTNYSTISGDKHTAQGVWYQRAFGDHVVFGCSTGCLVDSESVAFAYKKKPRLKDLYGCAIVYNSQHAKIVPFKDVR